MSSAIPLNTLPLAFSDASGSIIPVTTSNTLASTVPTTLTSTLPTTIPTTIPTTLDYTYPTTTMASTVPTTLTSTLPTTIPTTIPTTLDTTYSTTLPIATPYQSTTATLPTTMPLTNSSSLPATQPLPSDYYYALPLTTNGAASVPTGQLGGGYSPFTFSVQVNPYDYYEHLFDKLMDWVSSYHLPYGQGHYGHHHAWDHYSPYAYPTAPAPMRYVEDSPFAYTLDQVHQYAHDHALPHTHAGNAPFNVNEMETIAHQFNLPHVHTDNGMYPTPLSGPTVDNMHPMVNQYPSSYTAPYHGPDMDALAQQYQLAQPYAAAQPTSIFSDPMTYQGYPTTSQPGMEGFPTYDALSLMQPPTIHQTYPGGCHGSIWNDYVAMPMYGQTENLIQPNAMQYDLMHSHPYCC